MFFFTFIAQQLPLPPLLPSNPEQCQLSTDFTQDCIVQLVSRLLGIILPVLGGIATIMLIWGAWQYFTAYGNEERAKSAKATITWAIVGIVVIVLALVIVEAIRRFYESPINIPNLNVPK